MEKKSEDPEREIGVDGTCISLNPVIYTHSFSLEWVAEGGRCISLTGTMAK